MCATNDRDGNPRPTTRKPYHAPTLLDYGPVRDVTHASTVEANSFDNGFAGGDGIPVYLSA